MKTRLDVLLVEQGHVKSREEAQRFIMAGLVKVDGRVVDKAGTAVPDTVRIEVAQAPHPYVGRGGLKLQKALDTWPIDVAGAVALDVGASTGGFTHCLLLRGARRVYAVDVGYGQLDYRLRQDDRVLSKERLNARHLSTDDVPEPVDVATIDVSFISLSLLLPAVLPRIRAGGHCIALVKPQFEAGRHQIGRRGVVREPEVHRAVLRAVVGHVRTAGWQVWGLTPSPLRGPEGNVEFLCWMRREDASVDIECSIDDCLKAVASGGS